MKLRIDRIGFAVLLASVLTVGCASPGRVVDAGPSIGVGDGIPRITALYKRATEHHVHRFRKPLRDERARLLRELATECDRLLADMGSRDWDAGLIASRSGEQESDLADAGPLRASLVNLRAAAAKGNLRELERAHSSAAAAYARARPTPAAASHSEGSSSQ